MSFTKPLLMVAAGIAALASGAAHAQDRNDDRACAGLTALRLPDVRIYQTMMIKPAPTWDVPGSRTGAPSLLKMTKPFCRVFGVIEDEIEFEAWLPPKPAWNGRFLGIGNGGFAGFIRYEGLLLGATRGFATVSTNTGHRDTETTWAIGKPRRLENYGHRGQHLTAVNAQKIAAAFYGTPANYRYFLGCSGGGMQAMNEVQRYPADYDGIIAGASGQSIIGISARWLKSALYAQNRPNDALSPAEWRKVADAAVAKCDKIDGLQDGIITEPARCRFDPAETPGLPANKAAAARDMLGAITAKDGHVLFPAFPPGVAYEPLTSPGQAGEAFAHWVYDDAGWDFNKFDPARDVPLAEARIPGVSFTNPNLEAFARRGGKLITAHGLTDQIVPVQSTIDYHAMVVRYMGEQETNRFYRMFLAPAVDHCGGGAGADRLTMSPSAPSPTVDADHDLLEALVRWVEKGTAPEQVISSRLTDGRVTMTRPVCAFPKVPRWRGKGDPNDASSFQCAVPSSH